MCNSLGQHIRKVTQKSPLGWHMREQDRFLSNVNKRLGMQPIENFGASWVWGKKKTSSFGDGIRAEKKKPAARPLADLPGLGIRGPE